MQFYFENFDEKCDSLKNEKSPPPPTRLTDLEITQRTSPGFVCVVFARALKKKT